ncbi:N-acetylmuramoyl-L-alanine amidase [Megalops cyprinoides]|uniref:N-acetylmuramoyl-L-alanine amidase n=1 Tax=Megalops cyprinoides TaxID=118141 RepID=UPI001864764B|nr:N-acetylmuramoyl-L-alanine amidase [Megalops cyprinoides]
MVGMELTAELFMTLSMVCFCVGSKVSVLSSWHMDIFIGAVQQTEDSNPGLEPLAVVRSLRRTARYEDAFVRHFLGEISSTDEEAPVLDYELSEFFARAIHHRVTDSGKEEGVFLTPDGTTVAIAPLLLGIEAGLLVASGSSVPLFGLYPLTLAKNLGLSFLHFYSSLTSENLGPDGCWDNVTSPRVFTLSGPPSLVTDAWINGGMDGVILGSHLSGLAQHPLRLSSALKKYYRHHLEELGLDAAPRFISVLRRENFRELVNASLLQTQVLGSLNVYWRLRAETEVVQETALEKMVREGVQEFIHRYIECPAIIPRCQWRAKPYRGTPTRLDLPLTSMFIHHTYHPKPCHTFQQCAACMRAMQSFHQDVRGWDDIGYSFVAGSDGYLYEGRGWQWRGAHTRGHNSRGYGVAFVGNYTATLPAQRSLELVWGRLASCGVSGGRLVGNFTMYGHRQLVNTTCPGDALYAEIKGWQHFREIPSKQ